MATSLLELRHLRTLLALAECGNVSAAARRLNLTQSALSHQLKTLESHYGCALVDRRRQPLALTAAGERLHTLARSVLAQVQQAERELARIAQGEAGQLRIAVECHTCFDWLMPAMDDFRGHWPEVELDIVSGFHADPVGLLLSRRADLAVVSAPEDEAAVRYHPLFGYEMVAVLARDHPLAGKPWLSAADFARETLITYPVPDDKLDLVCQVLRPAGVNPPRRTTELTVAMVQLVASRRGVAALPFWAVKPYLERGYVQALPIGEHGLRSELYAATRADDAGLAYLEDFLVTVRELSFATLAGIRPLAG
ncbi:LysR family transcriptional regulator [Rivihabitans pingtungensis]|uniref:HTH-type transcriptional regulator MetR n=1 Tax=Rivihabitans pingtungensis TaxID=1054498 RepID=A0A318KNC5_9NEIS|nr:LysR family transcriptional regulator [Rivihabitans pingtungensis]PXX79291.1 transcriptional regulator [Rivihabitans pingtungensis]